MALLPFLVWLAISDPFTPNSRKFRFIFFYNAPNSISIYASMNPIYMIKALSKSLEVNEAFLSSCTNC